MGKPRLIILIRHAQSEGNKNRDIHQTIPDHRVKLTQEGWQQAYEAGRRLKGLLRPDDTLQFFTSPYRRTRETTEGILATLTDNQPEDSNFNRNRIKVYEEPRLREQDFGNFQPCSAEMERMWQERADYGHFFYRIPNGESAADAYDRVSGFNESLWRQFGDDDFPSVCVLVTHGLMSRVFLMKWYHFSVEYFEDLRNVNHCEFLTMRQDMNTGKYILENKLRTWSDLKKQNALEAVAREKEAEAKDKEKAETGKENGKSKDSSKLARTGSVVEIRRRWGGCPNGCNHDKNFKIRQTLADLVKNDHIISNQAVGLAGSENSSGSNSNSNTSGSNVTAVKNGTASPLDAAAALAPPAETNNSTPSTSSTTNSNNNNTTTSSTFGLTNPSFNGTANSTTLVSRRPAGKKIFWSQSSTTLCADGSPNPSFDISITGPKIDISKARDEVVSSPDGTPSFISVDDRLRGQLKSPSLPPHLSNNSSNSSSNHQTSAHGGAVQQLHVGRDFGGTYSGHNSVASGDDADSSEDERHRHTHHHSHTHDYLKPASHRAVFLTGPGSKRDNSRMGRGMRANRLGDCHSDAGHSSDGEHEADGEHETPDEDEDESGSNADGLELARTLTEKADEALMRAEMEDKSIQGSVY
ncbi:uncharacterized protein PODANS_3_8270 [Podospora anserina S mat+]|uniref:Phosphoglycerate mutase n=1 Tax=Podospora anserina (strain S / ATCC MYA-4624 / DSM 980 / FGSC 10383) TaxID=515849 RepID=B2B083_PODAN|nr:uncharacterized protein PODANS_3_8270 [Podospora anserina S mat+]CAP70764.1 unnamed protein product [Podospora anserina S mat+]CDP27356.1 Putative phosphoglycerate mutase [Podospora anserina S mat+]